MTDAQDEKLQTDTTTPQGLPELSDEEIQIISSRIHLLHEKLNEVPDLPSEIETIIRDHLRGAINNETVDKIYSGLGLYLEDEAIVFLLENMRRGNDLPYIEQVKALSPAPLWNFIRYLVALYGHDFRKAYAAFSENPNTWEVLNRNVFYDYLGDHWSIYLEIIKYNGEKLILEEEPASALNLVNGIVDALTRIPPEFSPEMVDPESIRATATLVGEMIELYAPDLSKELLADMLGSRE